MSTSPVDREEQTDSRNPERYTRVAGGVVNILILALCLQVSGAKDNLA